MNPQRGQASVEIVALTPIILLCGLLGLQALIAGANHVAAANALHAGVLAGELGRDPRAAARAAAPGWPTGRFSVSTRGRRVAVRLRPRAIVPPLADLLTVDASASFTKP